MNVLGREGQRDKFHYSQTRPVKSRDNLPVSLNAKLGALARIRPQARVDGAYRELSGAGLCGVTAELRRSLRMYRREARWH